MSSNKKRRELNRAIEEHDRVKLSAQFAVGNHSMLNIAESILAKENAALKEQITRLEESIEEITRKHQKHAGNYYASQDALAKLQSKSAALVVALERAASRFRNLSMSDNSMRYRVISSGGESELRAALAAFKGEK